MSKPRTFPLVRRAVGSVLLLVAVVGAGFALAAWKRTSRAAADAAAQNQPEPAEAIESALVRLHAYTRTSTAIGTVLALRSITLRNELAGKVAEVNLATGRVVEEGEVLVALDSAVEQAELRALEAESRLAESMLGRMERARESQGASAADVDRARAERDKAFANVERMQATIERKRLVAPFRARVGLVDLHVGQYLQPGTAITTLQGVADAVHVDFPVTQEIGARLQVGTRVDIVIAASQPPCAATLVAIDASVDATTRNTMVRAELGGVTPLPRPGASVRVRVPVGAPEDVPVVPVSALRRDPSGSQVFVLEADPAGHLRAHARRVTSGTSIGDDVLIFTGVSPGERVATTGSFKLREGALVHDVAAMAPKAN